MRSVESVRWRRRRCTAPCWAAASRGWNSMRLVPMPTFLNYGLELAERQQYELAAMDIGNLFHDSIDSALSG